MQGEGEGRGRENRKTVQVESGRGWGRGRERLLHGCVSVLAEPEAVIMHVEVPLIGGCRGRHGRHSRGASTHDQVEEGC